jgi:acetylornithine deacetylase/succinyl-diaminopimelate desuccinylase-like protein
MIECARWLASSLRRRGLTTVGIHRTSGAPIVVASTPHRAESPSVLLYAHYDVVAPGDERQWRSCAFEPTVSNGYIHGRGASDNKGPLWAQVLAVESFRRSQTGLPLNITLLLDGEEEVGSPSLAAMLRRSVLGRPDCIVACDTRMAGPNAPALTVSLRGSIGLELTVRGLPRDLHSGAFGGAVPNPASALARMMASFHVCCGSEVAVRHFYDGVSRRQPLAIPPAVGSQLRRAAGVPLLSSSEFSAFERVTTRPSLEITGVQIGGVGAAARNAIPAAGIVRLNARLVPEQDPEGIAEAIVRHARRTLPAGYQVSAALGTKARPVVVDKRGPFVVAADAACRRVFGTAPILVRSGGTIPAVGYLQDCFNAPILLLGFAQSADGMHGPNERFSVRSFGQAVATISVLLEEISHMPTSG